LLLLGRERPAPTAAGDPSASAADSDSSAPSSSLWRDKESGKDETEQEVIGRQIGLQSYLFFIIFVFDQTEKRKEPSERGLEKQKGNGKQIAVENGSWNVQN